MEAFSDIVIGFSLAQVGANLVIDERGVAGFLHSNALFGYILTFGLIASMWWGHNRLFAKYFAPNAACIILNFGMLGCLGLFVFSIQTLIKGGAAVSGTAGMEFYVTMFGLTYLFLGAMYVIGSAQRRPALSAEEFRQGMMRGLRLTTLAFSFLVAVTVLHRTGLHVRTVVYLFAPGFVAMILVTRVAPLVFPALRKAPKGAIT